MGMKKNKITSFLINIDYFIAGISLAILVIITFLGVLARYFLNSPFIWLQELQMMLFVWLTYIGAGAAFRTGSHIAINYLINQLPLKIRKMAEILISIVVISVLGYFMLKGIGLVKQQLMISRTTNILNIPFAFIYSALPIGSILMIINYIFTTYIFIVKKERKV